MTVSGGRSQEVVESVPGAPVPGGGYPGGAQQPSTDGVRYKYGPPTHQCPYGTISSPSGVRPIWLKCLDAPDATAGGTVVVTVTATDAATLLAQGSGITRQPPGDQVLISKDFIVYTSPDTQVLTTTVAGTPVTIHATPTSYTWDWGDGTTTTTTTPGAPWPNQTVTHRYTHTAQDVTTTLTTTWKATYTPAGGTTTPITGTITTTNTTTPYDLVRTLTYLTDQAETQQGH
ncbi:zinc transporter [Actinomyces procaprae]|uniref:zinc transporter n=1 Tax=Actinomyces procaprae TaxID=2560010 RepID=UPI00144529B2|nr:zinc transporter [Actinomyces procaprae]